MVLCPDNDRYYNNLTQWFCVRTLVGDVLSGNSNSGDGSELVRAAMVVSVYDCGMECVLIITITRLKPVPK